MTSSVMGKIMVIDDEPEIGWIFSKILTESGYKVQTAKSGEEGVAKIKKNYPDLVFLDMKLPGIGGLEVLKKIKEIDKEIAVIMITAYEDVKNAVDAMRLGAYDYTLKPVPIDRLKIIVDHVITTQKLTKEVITLQQKIKEEFTLNNIIGSSPQIQKIIAVIDKIAQNDITVLIRGESGTGKDLIAQAIHYLSHRKEGPFIPIDCAVLPESLVESELFGYEKGAFTGADNIKNGRFESANGGTIFLDEIGNMPPLIQGKLLRVLQERKIERLGGKTPINLDVRIITATNINLEEAIKKGYFREDLYHRINEFTLQMPPLRERGDDIILLADYFLNNFSKISGKGLLNLSPQAKEKLLAYTWPGNVRELKNVIKRAVLFATGKNINIEDLPPSIQNYCPAQVENKDNRHLKIASKISQEKTEKALILKVLEETHWNKSKTANILGIDYKTLYNKFKLYKIKK